MTTIKCLIVLFLLVLVQSYTPIHLSKYRGCDSSSSYSIYGSKEYLVTWSGDRMDDVCSMKFITNEKVCIQAQSYSVSDCSLRVKYYGGLYVRTFKRSYSCNDNPSEYCGEYYHDVTIKVDATSVYSSYDSFRLKVFIKHKTDTNTGDDSESPNFLGIGTGTGTTLIIIVAVAVGVYMYTKRSRGDNRTVVVGNQAHHTVVHM